MGVRLLIAFGILFSQAALARTLLYPGTFDPFHQAHLEEISAAKTHLSAERVIVLPIETAPYTPAYNGVLYPRLFPYDFRARMIESGFAHSSGFSVSKELKVLPADPLPALLKVRNGISDPDVQVVVGSDVIEKWEKSDSFNDFLSHAKILVTQDPANPSQFDELKKRWESHPSVQFLESNFAPLRAKTVKQELLVDRESAKYLIPAGSRDFLEKHEREFSGYLDDYFKKVDRFHQEWARSELLPKLIDAGVHAELGRFIARDPVLLKSLRMIDPDDVRSIQSFVTLVYQRAPPSLLARRGMSLYSDVYLALRLPEVVAGIRNYEHFRFLIQASDAAVSSKQKHTLKELITHLFFKNAGVASVEYPWLARLMSRLRAPFTSITIPTAPELHRYRHDMVKRPDTIKVYRGVPPRENIDEIVEQVRQNGFRSKVSLRTLQRTGDTVQADLAGTRVLQERGVQSMLLEHFLGDWKESSPFVATTLDRNVAANYAGKGGYIFELEIPVKDGVFANDLAVWARTPWERTGNPGAHLNEFVATRNVLPSEIRAMEQLKELPTALIAADNARLTANSAKIALWKARMAVSGCVRNAIRGLMRGELSR